MNNRTAPYYGNDEKGIAVKHIIDLYERVLSSSPEETDVRSKAAAELFSLQKEDGTWRVIRDPQAPSDARVDFLYMPTYYATAAIMKYMCDGGKLSEEEQKRFAEGLHAATGRQLNGHGYEATRTKLETLALYKDAGLYDWMKMFGDQYEEFSTMIRKEINGFRVGLMTGRTYSDWNRNFAEEFMEEVSDYEEAMVPWVWYAAYGSNISSERFMNYIRKCSDRSRPEEDRCFIFPFNMTFSGVSSIWGDKGKAFLDVSKEGMALGRIYRIRRSQFAEIQSMEGRDYTKRLHLGWEDEIPVYSFTTQQMPTESNPPAPEYVETIIKGLKETYPTRSELALRVYVLSRDALSHDDIEILSHIRRSEHGVSLQDLVEDVDCLNITRARKSVKNLTALGLLQHDRRSSGAGHRISDREATFYTRRESRDLIDILLLGVTGGKM